MKDMNELKRDSEELYMEEFSRLTSTKDGIRGIVCNAFLEFSTNKRKPVIKFNRKFINGFDTDNTLLRELVSKDYILESEIKIFTYPDNIFTVHSFTMLTTITTLKLENAEDYSRDFIAGVIYANNGIGSIHTFLMAINPDVHNFSNLPMFFITNNYYSKFNIPNNYLSEILTRNIEEGEGEFTYILSNDEQPRFLQKIFYKKNKKNDYVTYMESTASKIFKERTEAIGKGVKNITPVTKEDIFLTITSGSTKIFYQYLDVYFSKYFMEYNRLIELTICKDNFTNTYKSIKQSPLLSNKAEVMSKFVGITALDPTYDSRINNLPNKIMDAITIKTLEDIKRRYGNSGVMSLSKNNKSKKNEEIKRKYAELNYINSIRTISNKTVFKRFVSKKSPFSLTNGYLLDTGHDTIPLNKRKDIEYGSFLTEALVNISNDKVKLDSLLYSYLTLLYSNERIMFTCITESSARIVGELFMAMYKFYSSARILEITFSRYREAYSANNLFYIYKHDLAKKVYSSYVNAKRTINRLFVDIVRLSCYSLINRYDKCNVSSSNGVLVMYPEFTKENYVDVPTLLNPTLDVLDAYSTDSFDTRLFMYFKFSHFIMEKPLKYLDGRSVNRSSILEDAFNEYGKQ